jgi:hypothetical protein
MEYMYVAVEYWAKCEIHLIAGYRGIGVNLVEKEAANKIRMKSLWVADKRS